MNGKVLVWAVVVMWAALGWPQMGTAASPQTYQIYPNKRLGGSPLHETTVTRHCKCRSRCMTLPACLTWSSFVSSGGGNQLTCRLFDSAPQTYQLTNDNTAVTGYDKANDPDATNPTTTTTSPTTTTTTTTTPSPTTTSTTTTTVASVVTSYDSSLKNEEKCTKDRGVTGIVLKEGESDKQFNVEYLQCSRPTHTHDIAHFKVNEGTKTQVSMGPEPASGECPANSVIVDIKAYKQFDGSLPYKDEDTAWDNTPYMFSTCSPLEKWGIDSSDCKLIELYSGSTGTWPGLVDKKKNTDCYDNYLHCPLAYMAVQVTRQVKMDGSNKWYQVKFMKCCRIFLI